MTKLANYKTLVHNATCIRKNVIESIYRAQSGHPGGSLSCAEILSCLYGEILHIDPCDPAWPHRDRFILSKGHAAPAYYAALALAGYFPLAELSHLRQFDSILQGHPCMKKIPGVDFSSGSLGQGLSAANGMALAAKANGDHYRVYCLVGDGELDEGQVWEAAMTSAHYRLDNLLLFIDHNGLQIDGTVSDVMDCSPIAPRFRAFGWNVLEIDGHSIPEILSAAEAAAAMPGAPTAVICKTVKGKGVSYMENQVGWHGRAPDAEQYAAAMMELSSPEEVRWQ